MKNAHRLPCLGCLAGLLLSLVSVLPAAASVRFPLKVSANHRYLVDQDDQPFFLVGDAAWSLLTAVTKTEAEQYLENRRSLGFNTLIVNLVEHKFNGPINQEGEGPFLVPGDFSTPNEKYFEHADWVLRKAAEKGFLVLLAPCYLGYVGFDEGWYDEIRASGSEKCLRYGRFLGERYRDFPNILWMMGGDRDPGDARAEVRAVAWGINEFDQSKLFTAHCAPEESAADGFPGEPWLQVNNTYSYGIVHHKVAADYRRQPTMPTFLIESTYEGEHNATPVQIRRQAYWAPLCGAFGHVMGNNPIWLFNPGWKKAIEGTASRDMTRFRNLFLSRAWYRLVPLQEKGENGRINLSGVGEYYGLDFAAAARADDGATVIIYLPTSRQIGVDLGLVAGAEVQAWWYDPRTGAATSAGTFAAEGVQTFDPPGAGDWVLVLDDAAKHLPPPGTVDQE